MGCPRKYLQQTDLKPTKKPEGLISGFDSKKIQEKAVS
jgi:hypothetical protein